MAGNGATWHEDQLVPVTRNGRREDVWWTYSFGPIDFEGKVGGVLVVCKDVTSEHMAREALNLINEELKHRVKNTLTVLGAVATQTFRDVSSKADLEKYQGRLAAFGRAHDLLTAANWAAAPLRTVARQMFSEPDRAPLGPKAAKALGLNVPSTLSAAFDEGRPECWGTPGLLPGARNYRPGGTYTSANPDAFSAMPLNSPSVQARTVSILATAPLPAAAIPTATASDPSACSVMITTSCGPVVIFDAGVGIRGVGDE
jgi:hypothetical protein